MKKIIVASGLLLYSLIGFAQKTSVQATDTIVREVTTPEERINRLEAEITSLKTAKVEMRKQLSEIQSGIPTTSKKKKLVVNRAGSKQVNWLEN